MNGFTHIPVTPVAAPRQVWSDRWRQRDAVVRYRNYKDQLRAHFSSQLAETFEVVFVLPMPKSWSSKKRRAMNGTPHQQTPDSDNLLKAFKDALCEKDQVVFHDPTWKFWGEAGGIYYRPLDVTGVTLWDLVG